MELLFVSRYPGKGCRWHFGAGAMGLIVLLISSLAAASLYAGYRYGLSQASIQPDTAEIVLAQEFQRQRLTLKMAQGEAEDSLNALSQRLGEMQARLIRLDALGSRLTDMASLDSDEFNFDAPPPMGGPSRDTARSSNTVPDFLDALQQLSAYMDDRAQKMGVLESVLMNRELAAEVQPAGRPIRKGWTSSYFGKRTDPFTGKKAYHEGMDFAGKRGTEVVAVAAGVVTWSGKRSGYGRMVELTHGNGLVTRYAHNQENKVKLGERVEKGKVLALMGSSGRSTGPHVHFEVIKNGKVVNPIKYIRAKTTS